MNSPESPTPADRPDDPLAALDERLRAAQETADRLVREASEAARRASGPEPSRGGEAGRETGPGQEPNPAREPTGGGRRPPPRGYATPDPGPRTAGAEAQALAALLELARALLPPELRAQIAELMREILLLVRALIDWYLERLDERRRAPVQVEDIPIS